MSLTCTAIASIDALQSVDGSELLQSRPVQQSLVATLESGVGPERVNQVWAGRATLSPFGTYEFPFIEMVDPFGNGLTFTRIRAALFRVAPSSALLGVEIGCGDYDSEWFLAANEGGVVSPVYVRPGGAALYVATDERAYAVNHDVIKLANLDDTLPAEVDLILVGANK